MKKISSPLKIFIVEDDPWYGQFLEYNLSLNPDYEIKRFETGKKCINQLHEHPSVITLDYSLPDMSGDKVLKQIKQYDPEITVIIISGQEDVSTAVGLLKEGAYDYIVKDEEAKDRLWNVLRNIGENKALTQEIYHLKSEISQQYAFSKTIIGNSNPINKVFMLMDKAAKTNITVPISGETGTGKELVAKSIHYNSIRKNFPFIPVNVSAIPSELMESELFGHEKGSFTGAFTRRIGKFEAANKGTLFLDEISEMDLNMQAKLLRSLQEQEITRVGSNTIVQIDVRVVVSTNKDLAEEVKKGNFREDLYYRLLGLPIHLPPLRERGNDVLILSKYFLDQFCEKNKLEIINISPDAQKKLLEYSYPGNVRELKATIELASVMVNSDTIQADDITFNSSSEVEDLLFKERTMQEYTHEIIMRFLEKHDNDIPLVAKKLDIGKSTIYRILKEKQEN